MGWFLCLGNGPFPCWVSFFGVKIFLKKTFLKKKNAVKNGALDSKISREVFSRQANASSARCIDRPS